MGDIEKIILETTMLEFHEIVGKLLKNPSLENALQANLYSLKAKEAFYNAYIKGEEFIQESRDYSKLIHLCLRKFNEMIPGLNWQIRHIDLYCEQMRGRLTQVLKMNKFQDN